MSFADEISKFIQKTEQKATKLLQKTSEEMATKIAERTGVDTGNLLGNYRLGINSVGEHPGFEPGPTSWIDNEKDYDIAWENKKRAMEFFLNRLKSKVRQLTYKDSFYMDTDVEYADKVEYIGWKKTPPYRMFGKTIVEFENIVKQIASELVNV